MTAAISGVLCHLLLTAPIPVVVIARPVAGRVHAVTGHCAWRARANGGGIKEVEVGAPADCYIRLAAAVFRTLPRPSYDGRTPHGCKIAMARAAPVVCCRRLARRFTALLRSTRP